MEVSAWRIRDPSVGVDYSGAIGGLADFAHGELIPVGVRIIAQHLDRNRRIFVGGYGVILRHWRVIAIEGPEGKKL